MKTPQDIECLEDSGWGDEEIIREIEVRRGLSQADAQRWLAQMRGHDAATESRAERAELTHDWRRESLQGKR